MKATPTYLTDPIDLDKCTIKFLEGDRGGGWVVVGGGGVTVKEA